VEQRRLGTVSLGPYGSIPETDVTGPAARLAKTEQRTLGYFRWDRMTEHSDHCRIVGRSLVGERAVDEQTFASLTILTERLERLRKRDDVFSDIDFSSDVKKLKGRKNAVPVC